jgi:opacity protein-like surface antigen
MKNIFTLTVAAAVLVLAAQATQAIPVTGAIGFTGQAGYNTGSVGTATAVSTWYNTQVNGDSGSFSVLPLNSSVTIAAPWSFTTTSAIPSFWTAGGFTFELLSSWITAQGTGFVVVNGTGLVTAPGYDATTLSWSFSSQDPTVTDSPASWTFSASSKSVPDGGTTMLLLGATLSGIAMIKRKLSA